MGVGKAEVRNANLTHGGDIFAVAERRGIPWQRILDFSASINPLGPSPRVKEAILNSLDRIEHYPSIDALPLRRRLAEEWGVDQRQVLAGNGASDLLRDFCTAFGNGRHLAVPVFSEFHRQWPDASLCRADDVDTWPRQGTLVATRPVNPTGSLLDAGVVTEYLERSEATVLIDESFIEFSGAESLVGLTTRFPRLFVLRSLNKFYALPGLRLGAMAGHPDSMERLSQLRPPWSVNTLAEQAALAALDDREHAEATRQFVTEERTWFAGRIAALRGTRVWPSAANYLYVELPRPTEFVQFAAARDMLVRDCTGWPGCERSAVRVAVRRREDNVRLVTAWEEFLCNEA